MHDLMSWLEGSALGYAMRHSGPWTYAIVNLAHILGVSSLFGSLVIYQDAHALRAMQMAHDLSVHPGDGGEFARPVVAAVRPGARSAREMNHLPIRDGSLDFLRQSPARRKIYTHINNTNPILMPGTRERAQVEQAGIEIARDGLEIVL